MIDLALQHWLASLEKKATALKLEEPRHLIEQKRANKLLILKIEENLTLQQFGTQLEQDIDLFDEMGYDVEILEQ